MKEENKKGSKKVIIITIITLIILIIAIAVGYFLYQDYENKKSVGTTWGDTYYSILTTFKYSKEQLGENNWTFSDDMENIQLGFFEIKENKEPGMFISYTKDNERQALLYYIIKENELSYIEIKELKNLQLLYNIEKQDYIWYYIFEEDGKQKYIPLEKYLYNQEYVFSIEDMDSDENKISKFEETFIKTNIDIQTEEYNKDVTDKELKKLLREKYVKNYKTTDEIITQEVEQNVQNQLTQLKDKQEKIKKAEEEAKKAAEEEEKKKAEEEAKGLKVGNYTLKYGTYVGYAKSYDVGGVQSTKMTIKINQDGTLIQSGVFGGTSTITYTVSNGKIIASNGMPLNVTKNNEFILEAAEGVTFTYQE